MSLKSKKLLLLMLLVFIGLGVGLFLVSKSENSEISVNVLDYGYGVCTLDVPSSSCGPYEVNTQLSNGEKITYHVNGFDNRDSKKYDEITLKIAEAKKQNTLVKIKVNNKRVIISVQ